MLGTRLKELREEKGLTQEELGKRLNLTKANISKYESGKLEPNIETINYLANFFETTADYLLGRSTIRRSLTDKDALTINKDETEHAPIAFSGDMSDINVEALEKIINRAVKNALEEREREKKE